MLLLLLAAFGPVVTDVDFAATPLEVYRRLDGRTVRVAFEVTAPAWTLNGVTALGIGENDDRAVPVVCVPACDADQDDSVLVVGVLRVVEHEARVLGGVRVEAWTEIRIRGRLVG